MYTLTYAQYTHTHTHITIHSGVEADNERLSNGAHSALLYDTWLMDIPKLLDMCAVYR